MVRWARPKPEPFFRNSGFKENQDRHTIKFREFEIFSFWGMLCPQLPNNLTEGLSYLQVKGSQIKILAKSDATDVGE